MKTLGHAVFSLMTTADVARTRRSRRERRPNRSWVQHVAAGSAEEVPRPAARCAQVERAQHATGRRTTVAAVALACAQATRMVKVARMVSECVCVVVRATHSSSKTGRASTVGYCTNAAAAARLFKRIASAVPSVGG